MVTDESWQQTQKASPNTSRMIEGSKKEFHGTKRSRNYITALVFGKLKIGRILERTKRTNNRHIDNLKNRKIINDGD